MLEEVSTVRLYLLRALYLLNLVLLGPTTCAVIIKHQGLTDPLPAVAYSFWGVLAALSALGIRYPVKMLLLVFVQLLYKSSWMLAVALPLWSTYRTGDYTQVMVLGIVLDVIAIPWAMGLYLWIAYVKAPGDRWRGRPPGRKAALATRVFPGKGFTLHNFRQS
jgi:hypothetical protein